MALSTKARIDDLFREDCIGKNRNTLQRPLDRQLTASSYNCQESENKTKRERERVRERERLTETERERDRETERD